MHRPFSGERIVAVFLLWGSNNKSNSLAIMEAGAARGTVEVREDIRRVMLAVDEHEGSFYALEWTLKNLHDSIIKFQPGDFHCAALI